MIKTFSNCDLLSSNVSVNSTHCKNRVTLINNSNYSNLVFLGSTNAKLFKKLDSFNSNKSIQINKIRNSNYSNNLLYIPQYQNKKNIYSYNNHKRTLNPENTIIILYIIFIWSILFLFFLFKYSIFQGLQNLNMELFICYIII